MYAAVWRKIVPQNSNAYATVAIGIMGSNRLALNQLRRDKASITLKHIELQSSNRELQLPMIPFAFVVCPFRPQSENLSSISCIVLLTPYVRGGSCARWRFPGTSLQCSATRPVFRAIIFSFLNRSSHYNCSHREHLHNFLANILPYTPLLCRVVLAEFNLSALLLRYLARLSFNRG